MFRKIYEIKKFWSTMPDSLPTVAELGGGAPGARPPMDQNFFNFMGFFRKCIHILGWHPLLRQVLDPPLANDLHLNPLQTWVLKGRLLVFKTECHTVETPHLPYIMHRCYS